MQWKHLTNLDLNPASGRSGAKPLGLPGVAATVESSYGTAGQLYYDTTNSRLRAYVNGSWSTLASGSGNTLDAAYDQGGAGSGAAIDVDSGPVTLTVSDNDNCTALAIVQNDSTNNPAAMTITNNGSGNDITGTAFSIGSTGNAYFAGTLTVGASGSGADVTFYDSTAGDWVLFDVSAHVVQFEDTKLQLMDDTKLALGDSSDWTMNNVSSDSNSLKLDPAAANQVLKIGTVTDCDIVWNSTAGAALTCDASANSITVSSGAYLKCTGSGTGKGMIIPSHASASPNAQDGAGNIFFEIDAKKLWVYDGSSWVGTVLS